MLHNLQSNTDVPIEQARPAFAPLPKRSGAFDEQPVICLLRTRGLLTDGQRTGECDRVCLGAPQGFVYVLDCEGRTVEGWPLQMGAVQAQVAVADINSDGALELVAADARGNVAAFSADGSELWERHVSSLVAQVAGQHSTPHASACWSVARLVDLLDWLNRPNKPWQAPRAHIGMDDFAHNAPIVALVEQLCGMSEKLARAGAVAGRHKWGRGARGGVCDGVWRGACAVGH